MIYRLAVAAVLTAALLAAAAPALAVARADATDHDVARQVADLSTRIERFVARNDPTPGGRARLVVTLRLPRRTPTTAAVRSFGLRTRAETAVATWHHGDDGSGRAVLAGLPLRSPLALDGPGRYRLRVRLWLVDGAPALSVRRFKSDTAPRPAHA